MRQTSGYAIPRMPAALVQAYDSSMRTHQAWKLFQRLCEALKSLPRSAYRGISRDPLSPLPSSDPEILGAFEDSGGDMHTNRAARLHFMRVLGDDYPVSDFDDDLLPNFPQAAEVFSLLESPDEYEIVQLVRDTFCTTEDCLGFDIGYWGGDHYSILCDSALTPLWHPPQPDCFDELASKLKMVNEHFLFRSPEDAARFRSYYRTLAWGETESYPDEFCIIQVIKPRA
jgi:hypothetical protein